MNKKLTVKAACEVARIHRDRFNEHVAAGRFPCAPTTIPGRTRTFDSDDMIALCLFSELIEDEVSPSRSGAIACEVARVARQNPNSPTISLLEDYFYPSMMNAYPSEKIPNPSEWGSVHFNGSRIRKVTTFNISNIRERVSKYIEEQLSIIGEAD